MVALPAANHAPAETDDRYHSFRGVSFGGVVAAQFWCDFIVWEAVLNERTGWRGIVELGTWTGGFSLYLAAQAAARGAEFRTYDATPPDREVPGFVRLDIFAEADRVGEHLRSVEPCVLFCDDGNKPRELRTFPPYLRDPASLVIVHDWGTEVLPSDVPENLLPVYEDYCESLGSISRVFRVRS